MDRRGPGRLGRALFTLALHRPRYTLQLGLDRFADFLIVDEALCLFHDFAVAGDEEAGGISEQPSELVCYRVIAPQDGVVHREVLTVHVEAFFGGVRGHHVIAFVIHVDAKNDEALGGILLLHLDQPGDFDLARFAPRGPEIDRKSTRLNSSHGYISYAVFCLKKKKKLT